MREFEKKKVLVVGLGKSGVAAARFCAERGALVKAVDSKPEGEMRRQVESLSGLPIEFSFGEGETQRFAGEELVVVSPGVPSESSLVKAAKEGGAEVVGEMELAVREIKKPILAVTGTNGKTTTTTLIGHLLRGAGVRACVAGNIGTPLLDVIGEAQVSDMVVIEVSSFQIETSPSLAPEISVLLNVTPDHLDRHHSFESYSECKALLVKRTAAGGFGIYNAADEVAAASVAGASCELVPFDATGRVLSRQEGRKSAWFGGGDLVVEVRGPAPSRYPLCDVKLEGMHNRENMLAALAACELCGAEPAKLKAALESFAGLPHRMELVGESRGVRYYDDSKGTNIGATIRAIEAFAEPIVLIAGGLSKGVDFAPLAGKARGRVKKAILIGEAAGDLESALDGSVPFARASSMEDAVRQAGESADPGDIVLLSPACASFDMFRDYAHRGEAFVSAVKRIEKGGGGGR